MKNTFYSKYIKRLLDILLSLFVIILFSWLYLILFILVRVKLGSPVLFKQQRPGKDEKIFGMYKFRSMTDERDENGELLPDEVRLTAFGKKLRSTSLDELPEFFNILKGDMSFIGPRPLLVKYLPYYTDRERLRHSVRPGLTGYAQAHGRNAISWEKKFEYDIYYVEHLTFMTDIRIIIDTVKAVFVREGIQLNALPDFDDYRKENPAK
ncbi:sugar transferase [Butyrivibrio sp. CB08]|uniref:sugar transferase n=1 Tax=Butyrivibrio sp. CB08 TaxID=2364879 RepID=UPI000EA86AA1|nr:sugar transferase [Butyrivibrio sp. CB08]RKM59815.1 sugar transferase [Butyrivibrio sp. CB08]